MKYLITESKLEESIVYYINELFDVNDINWTYPLNMMIKQVKNRMTPIE
ncbi:hypothetical protein CCP3SC5AM1_1960005 [Gammaproteobacteria bacterium]